MIYLIPLILPKILNKFIDEIDFIDERCLNSFDLLDLVRQKFCKSWLSYCIIFMNGYCSWGQISKIKQCCHFGILGHLENWILVSKMENGIAKWTFFLKIVIEYSFGNLEPLWNPFLYVDQSWWNYAWPHKETFQSSRIRKTLMAFDDVKKMFLCVEKFKRFIVFPTPWAIRQGKLHYE